MGWSIGYDTSWKRDIGYGVPAVCDFPGCNEQIDRGLGYVCGGDPFGGELGCGLYFCGKHGGGERCCQMAHNDLDPKPDVREWTDHKLTHESWQRWRDENPAEVARLRGEAAKPSGSGVTETSDQMNKQPAGLPADTQEGP